MSYGVTPSTVAEYQQRAEEAERSPLPWILKAVRVLVWVVYALVLLTAINLTLAFFLLLFGASPDAAFVEWVYGNTQRAMEPFRGIFPTHVLDGTSVLDTSLLFATIVYFLLALLFHYAVHWLTEKIRRHEWEVANTRSQAHTAAQSLAAQEHNADVAARQAAAREFAAQQASAQQYAVAKAAAQEVVAQHQATPPPPSPAVPARPAPPRIDVPPPPP